MLLCLGLLSVLVVMSWFGRGRSTFKPTVSDGLNHSKGAAHSISKKFVLDRLKAPATAEFAEMGAEGTWVHEDRPGQFTVKSYVDSQNAFGAKLRTWYICKVRSIGGDDFTLEGLTTSK